MAAIRSSARDAHEQSDGCHGGSLRDAARNTVQLFGAPLAIHDLTGSIDVNTACWI